MLKELRQLYKQLRVELKVGLIGGIGERAFNIDIYIYIYYDFRYNAHLINL